ncbi:coatomer epsilon subunit-domain-containing protein, partial [Jimgerdemannia flammicorona]
MADSVDELFAIRNLFSLGAYQTLINEVSSSRAPLSDAAKQEAKSYLYRSYIAQGKYNLVISELKDSQIPEQHAIRLLAIYLQAKSKGDNTNKETTVKRVTELLAESTNVVNSLVQLVAGTVLYNEGLLEDALKVLHHHGKNLEVRKRFTHYCEVYLKLEPGAIAGNNVLSSFMTIDRLDLARKEVAAAKQWSEDAMLAQLLEAWVDLRIGGDKYKEAFYIFEEFAQSHSANTVKVLNGQAVANIALARYPEAESLLLEALKI